MRQKALNLLVELDKIYASVIKGETQFRTQLDHLIISILEFTEEEIKDEIIGSVIINFNNRVNLISAICPQPGDKMTLEELRESFQQLELSQFNINNNYILGTLSYQEIEQFQTQLFTFRDQLYAIPISDNNIIEIANMKSKIQHYETETLEDEDVLQVAYHNSN